MLACVRVCVCVCERLFVCVYHGYRPDGSACAQVVLEFDQLEMDIDLFYPVVQNGRGCAQLAVHVDEFDVEVNLMDEDMDRLDVDVDQLWTRWMWTKWVWM